MLDLENSAEYLGNISPGYFGGRARSRLRAAFACLQTGITADVYIDGFNLYYGALRKNALQLAQPAQALRVSASREPVAEIKYYTALVTARPCDPD